MLATRLYIHHSHRVLKRAHKKLTKRRTKGRSRSKVEALTVALPLRKHARGQRKAVWDRTEKTLRGSKYFATPPLFRALFLRSPVLLFWLFSPSQLCSTSPRGACNHQRGVADRKSKAICPSEQNQRHATAALAESTTAAAATAANSSTGSGAARLELLEQWKPLQSQGHDQGTCTAASLRGPTRCKPSPADQPAHGSAIPS